MKKIKMLLSFEVEDENYDTLMEKLRVVKRRDEAEPIFGNLILDNIKEVQSVGSDLVEVSDMQLDGIDLLIICKRIKYKGLW